MIENASVISAKPCTFIMLQYFYFIALLVLGGGGGGWNLQESESKIKDERLLKN
ncbi:hypothetical protein ACJX0J_032287, partial [Zea mays]